MANRTFNRRQALEKEVKELYAEVSGPVFGVEAEAVLDLSTDITLTDVEESEDRNGTTFQLVVNAAAANPLATVLVSFTGTAAAIICTVTPNDGTNNGAVAVSLDEDELAELINTGLVAGKTITLTDVNSRRILQTATGGAAANALVPGDNQTATFSGGVTAVSASFINGIGFASVTRSGTGQYTLTLQDEYMQLKSVDAVLKKTTGEDIQFQVWSEDVDGDRTVVIQCLTGATPTDPSNTSSFLVKVELKNSSAL